MSWDTLPKDNLEYLLSKLKTDVLDYKVDTEAGKGLSSNDYTTAEKNKLAGIAANATKVESSETNGNIKINSEETVVYDDAEIQAKIDTSSTETDYANPLSLETMQAQHAKNTKIKLDPIQDLHGYDKPWTGGARKNLMPLTVEGIKASNIGGTWSDNTYTYRGCTFVVNTDSDGNVISIKVTGTAIETNDAILYLFGGTSYINNSYKGMKLNGNSSSNNKMQLAIYYSSNGTSWSAEAYQYNSTDLTVSSDYDYCRVLIQIKANNAVPSGGLIFYPMIRLSTVTDDTFEPYTNISSISGHDQIDILGCGKNLLTAIDEAPGTQSGITFAVNDDPEIILSGTYSSAVYRRLIKDYTLKLEPGSTYTLSGAYSGQQLRLREWDVNGNLLATNLCNSSTPVTFTVNTNTDHVDVYLIIYSLSNTVIKPQLEKNSSQTDWEPYQESNNKTLDLPQTVYGGILDLESGELVVNHGAVDLGSLTWDTALDNNHYRHGTQVPNSIQNVVGGNSDVISSQYMKFTGSSRIWDNLGTGYFTLNNSYVWGSRLVIKDDRYTDATSFKTGVTGQTIYYELAAPFTLYISPEHLKLLKAQNNLTTSQYTQIKVTYRNGIFATLEELSDTANGIYDEISGDATTVSGNPINFTTREKQKSKSTIIDLEPIQDLHGFTKPWVGGAGKNLLPMTVDNIKALNTTGTWNDNVYTLNNVIFTVLTDNDNNVIGIKVGGSSASANTNFYIVESFGSGLLASIITGCPANGGSSSYRMFWDNNGTDTGTGATVDSPTNGNVRIQIISGYTPNNLIFYPMIRLSSVTDSTFEPYTNIASISGRSSVDIDGCGKNIIPDGTNTSNGYVANYILKSDNSSQANSSYNISEYFRVTGNESYMYCSYPSTSGGIIAMCFYDSEKQYISGVAIGTGETLVTSPQNAVYARATFQSALNTTYKMLVCKGATKPTDYEPYQQSNDITISLGETIYGGQLDVEKGKVKSKIDLKDLGDITYEYDSSYHRFYGDISDSKSYTVREGMLYSSCYESITDGRPIADVPDGSCYMSAKRVYIHDSRYTNPSDLQNAIDGQTLGYELDTPTTIQLTPQQVQLLKGINNISTTGTTITVTFKNGSVAHLDDLPENVFTDLDKEKLASIDTLAVTLDLLTHTLVVTQDI